MYRLITVDERYPLCRVHSEAVRPGLRRRGTGKVATAEGSIVVRRTLAKLLAIGTGLMVVILAGLFAALRSR